jgi:hypothetical protein
LELGSTASILHGQNIGFIVSQAPADTVADAESTHVVIDYGGSERGLAVATKRIHCRLETPRRRCGRIGLWHLCTGGECGV